MTPRAYTGGLLVGNRHRGWCCFATAKRWRSAAVRCEWAAGSRPTAAVRVRIDPAKLPADGLRTTVHIRLVKPTAQTVDVSVTWRPL